MKYTFTNIDGHEKTVNIGEDVLAQGKREGLSTRETIDRFLSDEGYIVDPTVRELTEKAKSNGINNAGKVSSGKRKAPTRKPDLVKRMLIEGLSKYMSEAYAEVKNVQVTNIERIIAFSIGDDNYELTLSKKRKPKTS
jgi:hypothetical protein